MKRTDPAPNGSPPRAMCSLQMLERVAQCLDCPVDSLLTGSGMPVELAQTDELLRLWMALRTEDARERVLRILRDTIGR